MTPLLAQILFIGACGIVLYRAEPAINRMSAATPRLIRAAFCLLASSAGGGIAMTILGVTPDWLTVLFAAGIAALLFCERRITALTRVRPQPEKGARHA